MENNTAVRISCVSYLNSKPFIYGLENSNLLQQGGIELSLDIPSRCAEKLLNNEVDIGLVPVACLPLITKYNIISNYCIGAIGKVYSVNLYSDVPIEKIKEIVLDYQSLTSINLTKILAKFHWKIAPTFVDGDKDFINTISGNTAAVIIGDRTFGIEYKFNYVYDLSEEWEKLTGLPFVFAAWVSNKKISTEFLVSFEHALTEGINSIEHVAEMYQLQYAPYDVKTYLTKHIDYSLDEKKKRALELFLSYLKKI